MSIDAFLKMFPKSGGRPEGKIDNLYIDLSGIARTIPAADMSQLETKIFDHVMEKIRILGPDLVVVVADGSLPLARLADRRRQNHLEARARRSKNGGEAKFGVVSIAGMRFMNDLSARICEFLKEKGTECKTLPPSAAGEAVCKIVCSIAKAKDEELNCVLGALSLGPFAVASLEKKRVWFMQEEKSFELSAMSELLTEFVKTRCKHLLSPITCLRDVCFLATLDYLGPLPGGCRGSIERAACAFADAVRLSNEKSLCDKGAALNKKLLATCLSQIKKGRAKQTEKDVSVGSPVVNMSLGEEKWRLKYWKLIFNVDVNCDGKKKAIVKRYVTGLVWYMGYLNATFTDWQWFYEHDAAPPLEDLLEHLDCLDDVQLGKTRAVKPLEGLAFAIDYTNLALLPKGYKDLVDARKLAHLYPEDVEVVSVDGLPIARLPSAEFAAVSQVVKGLKLTNPEKERNKLDR